MICLVILILSLLLFIQSLYSLSKLLSLVLFLLLLVITLDIEHLNTYHYNILLGLVNIRSKGLMKQYYTSQEQNLFNFTVALHVLQPAPVLIHVHLRSWLGLMTSELKGLTKKSSQGENLFLCNKFISSSINVYCIITQYGSTVYTGIAMGGPAL